MSKEPSPLHSPSPLCQHLDHLVDELRVFIPAALHDFDPQAIHKARVATRRLKASLDLLDSCIAPDNAKPFAKIGRRLRRRLGPLRDIDVMLEHLDEIASDSPSFGPGVRWLRERLLEDRHTARAKASQQVPATAVLARLGTWWGLRQDVIDADPAVSSLLGESLHLQLDRFVEHADEMVRARTHPVDATPKLRDPHELRIAGKALRYTLELAQAQGHPLPGAVLKTFKQMQESLGAWHDYVVLAERAMQASLDAELPLHDPAMQRQVLTLADFAMRHAQQDLEQFGKLWSEQGGELSKTIRANFPLTKPAATPAAPVSEPQTGPGRADSPTPPAPQAVSTDSPPAA